jgi:hypothetical protein
LNVRRVARVIARIAPAPNRAQPRFASPRGRKSARRSTICGIEG